jgi:preprotein translocase subunit SecG
MYTFLLVLLILDAIVLVAAILLQSGKGGGLAASFGGASSTAEALIGNRQAGNLLTKTSWTAGGLFLALAFILQLAGARSRAPQSILDKTFSTPAPAAPPATGGTPGAAPAVPLTPSQGAPAPAPAGGPPQIPPQR